MQYEIDSNGYVTTVLWGCNTGQCNEYTGAIPTGYNSLVEWANNACINAYYLDDNDNFILDAEREAELNLLHKLQEIDNTPVLFKDLNGSLETLNEQYEEATASGAVIWIDNARSVPPTMKFTEIKPLLYSKIDIFAQTKQMLRDDAITKTIGGITFTKKSNGGILIEGTATADIEYNLSGSNTNTDLICGLKKGHSYYLNVGGLSCEMRYHDGETTEQVYSGTGGIISLSECKNITQVVLKIPNEKTVNTTIYPMLEYGTAASEWQAYKSKRLSIDFGEYITVYPSDTLYPSLTLFPREISELSLENIDYILLEGGAKIISGDGISHYVGSGLLGLLNGYNFIYTTQDTSIEVTYRTNVMLGMFRGKVFDPDNIEMIGNTGLLSTLQYIGENIEMSQCRSFQKIGFTWYESEYVKSDIVINVDIPENFVITEAKLTLRFRPLLVNKVWSRLRNLRLYKGSEDCSFVTNGYALEYADNGGLTEISNALGTDGWTSDIATNTNHPLQTKLSEDIKDSLSVGNQVLHLRSSYSVPAASSGAEATNAALYSGMAVAVLNVTGYRKYN